MSLLSWKKNATPDNKSGLDILAKVAAIDSEKNKQAIGGPNLVINLAQQQGQNALVARQPGFTSTGKKIDAKNLGKYFNFFLMGIVR